MSSRAVLSVVVVSHISAAASLTASLGYFLTPPDAAQFTPQYVRYASYFSSVLLIAFAVGSVLVLFVTGSSWVPAIYLWSLPLTIVALPVVAPIAAGFVYVGVTSKFAGGLAGGASSLWIVGVLLGAWITLRIAKR